MNNCDKIKLVVCSYNLRRCVFLYSAGAFWESAVPRRKLGPSNCLRPEDYWWEKVKFESIRLPGDTTDLLLELDDHQ